MSDSDKSSADGSTVAELVLVAVTIVWGATFLIIQVALRDSGPFGMLTLRFGLAAAVMYVVFRSRMSRPDPRELWAAGAIGLATFASYAFQTTGLQYIPSSRSAFITALYVPAVPILQLLIIRRSPRLSAWLGIVISFAGLLVLSSDAASGLGLSLGDWLTVGCALTAALQIVLIGRFAPTMEPMRLAYLQFAVVAILSAMAFPLAGEPLPSLSPTFVACVLGLGLIGTAFGLGAMNWAQQTVSATRATVIYALEPVWAGVFGAVAGELITGRSLAGSALIVSGVLVSELPWRRLLGRS